MGKDHMVEVIDCRTQSCIRQPHQGVIRRILSVFSSSLDVLSQAPSNQLPPLFLEGFFWYRNFCHSSAKIISWLCSPFGWSPGSSSSGSSYFSRFTFGSFLPHTLPFGSTISCTTLLLTSATALLFLLPMAPNWLHLTSAWAEVTRCLPWNYFPALLFCLNCVESCFGLQKTLCISLFLYLCCCGL